MEEQIISLETAKLAKEKIGFNEYCVMSYQNGELTLSNCNITAKEESTLIEYYAPSQSLLQKYLRELPTNKKQLVYVENSCGQWNWVVENVMGYIESNFDDDIERSYEEVLELGLQAALNLIK